MNPFTQEQIQRGKNFTQEERSNFDAFVASGTDPVKAFEMTLSLSGKQTDSDLKGAENIFKSALSTVQSPFRGIGEGIGNIIAQPFVNRQQQEVQAQGENITQQLLQRLNQARQAGNQSEVDRYTRALQWVDTGAGITDEFAQNLPSNREVIGSALQTAGIIGGFGAGGATGSLARQAGIGAAQEAGAGAIIGLGSGLSDPNATAGDIARDTIMGAGIGAAVGAGIPVAIAGAGSVARAGSRLSEYLNRVPQNVVREVSQEVPTTRVFNTIEEAIKDTSTGRTAQNTSEVRQALAGGENILTEAEKRRLLGIDPSVGREFLDTLKLREADDTAQTVFGLAEEKTAQALEQVGRVLSDTGSDIGRVKEKLKTLPADKSDITSITSDIKKSLEGKGLKFSKGQFVKVKGRNTPFSDTDINAINRDIVGTINNISKSESMEQLLLGIERLDNIINYNTTGELTTGLQGISKNARAKLAQVRNKALTAEEAKLFEEYAGLQDFYDEFLKGNAENRISTLLNRFNAKNSNKSQRFATKIKELTGIDVADYAQLARILAEATPANSPQRALLDQYIGGNIVSGITNLSARGVIESTVGTAVRKAAEIDKLAEIEKALMTVIRQ